MQTLMHIEVVIIITLNYGKFSLKYRGAVVWNSLLAVLKESKSHRTIKKSLKLYIQTQLS